MDKEVRMLEQLAQLEAERITALDEIGEITEAIDLAALAVIGMAKELGGDEGQLLANYLREQADGLRKAKERLSTMPNKSLVRWLNNRSTILSH
jgi:hypothetical protein